MAIREKQPQIFFQNLCLCTSTAKLKVQIVQEVINE